MPTVSVVPISTYHGQAMPTKGASASLRNGTAVLMALAKTTNVIAAMPTASPMIASRSDARFERIPSRNDPSKPPYVKLDTDSATTTTGVPCSR